MQTPRHTVAPGDSAFQFWGPGATLCYQAGSGCLAARVTRAKGGSRWAVPKSSRDGMGMITSRLAPCPRPAPELASLRPPAAHPGRAHASLRSLGASLRARPAPEPRCVITEDKAPRQLNNSPTQ